MKDGLSCLLEQWSGQTLIAGTLLNLALSLCSNCDFLPQQMERENLIKRRWKSLGMQDDEKGWYAFADMLYLFSFFVFTHLLARRLLLKYSRLTGSTLIFLAPIYPLCFSCGSPAFFLNILIFFTFFPFFLNPRCVIWRGDGGLDIKTRWSEQESEEEMEPTVMKQSRVACMESGERIYVTYNSRRDGNVYFYRLGEWRKWGGGWSVCASVRRGGGFFFCLIQADSCERSPKCSVEEILAFHRIHPPEVTLCPSLSVCPPPAAPSIYLTPPLNHRLTLLRCLSDFPWWHREVCVTILGFCC